MDREPGVNRTASIIIAIDRHRGADHDCLRSRSRTARKYRSMRPGWALGARDLRSLRAAEFPQDVRLEGASDLRSPEHENDIPADKIIRERAGAPSRAWASRAGCLGYEKGGAHQQSLRRLEPERSAQDDDLGLLSARARASDGFHAGYLGRSRAGAKEKRCGAAGVRGEGCTRARGEDGRSVRAGAEIATEAATVGGPGSGIGERKGRGRGHQHRRPGRRAAARRKEDDEKDAKKDDQDDEDESEVNRRKAAQGIIPAREPYGATLRWHLGMGLSDMEARFLSRETCAKEISELLRIETECRRGQLHLPPVGKGDDCPELDRRNARSLSLHD